MPKVKNDEDYIDIEIGKFELLFNKNYQLLTIVNDLTLGLLYVTGSILFMFDSTQNWAMAAYLIGGIQLTSRPILKLYRAAYLRRISTATKQKETGNQTVSTVKKEEDDGDQTVSTVKKRENTSQKAVSAVKKKEDDEEDTSASTKKE